MRSRGRARRRGSRRRTARRRRGSGSRSLAQLAEREARTPVVQSTCESASSRVRGVTAARIASASGGTTTTRAPRRVKRAEQAEVLGSSSRSRPPARARARRGRCCSRRSSSRSARPARLDADEPRRARRAPARAARASARTTPCRPGPARGRARCSLSHRRRASAERAARTCRRSDRRSARAPGRARAPRSNVIRPSPRPAHGRRARAHCGGRRSSDQTRERRGGEPTHEHVVDARPERREARQLEQAAARRLKSPASTTGSPGASATPSEALAPARPRGRELGMPEVVRRVEVRDDEPPRAARRGRHRRSRRPASIRLVAEVARAARARPRAGSRSPDRRSPSGRGRGSAASSRRRAGAGSHGGSHDPASRASRSSGRAAAAPRAAAPGGRARPGDRPWRARTISCRKLSRPGGFALPWKTFQLRTSSARARTLRAMRVVLADPPAFTPALRPRARRSARTSGRRGRARDVAAFASAPCPIRSATERRELFYPVSSRGLQSARGCGCRQRRSSTRSDWRGSLACRADVVHLQWLAAPELDALAPPRTARRSCFTAHDLLPRRTAAKTELWRRLFGRFERVVVHSESGREVARRLRRRRGEAPRDPPSRLPERSLARRTTAERCSRSALIRPYKRLDHAVDGGSARTARACSSPAIPSARSPNRRRRRAGASATSRTRELERALGDATVAVFPYRAELDQSGALLQALGAGIPAVVYDVGGLAEPVRSYGAGPRRSRRRRRRRSAPRSRELLGDPRRARSGTGGRRRARAELTWDAAARGPPRALPGAARDLPRRGRFDELVRRQLDLFADDDAELLAEADEAEAAWRRGRPRGGRGGVRRPPARPRRGADRLARHPRRLRGDARGGRRGGNTEAVFARAAAKRLPPRFADRASRLRRRVQDRGLRADRRPADGCARRPERLDRLALLPPLRLGRLLRRAARRPSRMDAGCSRRTVRSNTGAPLPRPTRSCTSWTSTPPRALSASPTSCRRAATDPDVVRIVEGARGQRGDADGARDSVRLRLDRPLGAAARGRQPGRRSPARMR